jgi:septal ring factor EnvC (AmiA/AmiB activator)
VNDTRFIEFDGKWGLKSWTKNWKTRILEIEKEILDYKRLVSLQSKFEQEEKARKAELMALDEKKATLQSRESKIINEIQSIGNKIDICQKRRNELHDKNIHDQQLLNGRKLRRLYYLCVTALIVVAGCLLIIVEISYESFGILPFIILLVLAALLMIRSYQNKRRVISGTGNIEESILRLDQRLVQLNKKVSDLEKEEGLIQTEMVSINPKLKQIQSELEKLRGKVEEITKEINKYNVSSVSQEREALTQKMKTVGVI